MAITLSRETGRTVLGKDGSPFADSRVFVGNSADYGVRDLNSMGRK